MTSASDVVAGTAAGAASATGTVASVDTEEAVAWSAGVDGTAEAGTASGCVSVELGTVAVASDELDASSVAWSASETTALPA